MNKEIILSSGEILRDVVGFEGLYKVSDQGNVYSMNYKQMGIMHKMKLNDMPNHYKSIMIVKNKIKYKFLIHRLVAQAFPEICGKWFEGCEVNHKNEKPWDNRAVNLETCDRLYNTRYGTGIERRAKKHSKPVARYSLNGELLGIFLNARIAALMTGAEYKTISLCCHGKVKTHRGERWAFIDL